MHYTALIHQEGKQWLAEFPDAPGCQTFSDSRAEIDAMAKEALEGWLEAHLVDGKAPPRPRPRPRRKAPRNRKPIQIFVSARLSAALGIRWTRLDLGITQSQLAKLAGMSQQQIAKVEDPDQNPTIKTLERVAGVIGIQFDIAFDKAPALLPVRSGASRRTRAA